MWLEMTLPSLEQVVAKKLIKTAIEYLGDMYFCDGMQIESIFTAAPREYGEMYVKEKLADFTISLEASFVAQAVANARRSALEEAIDIIGNWKVWTPDHINNLIEAIRVLLKEKKS
jgi:hypothetical protein